MTEVAKFGQSVGEVFIFALLFGLSLPAMFAFGIRAMAWGVGGDAEIHEAKAHPVGKWVGYACFAVVLAAIGYGLYLIIMSGQGHH